MGKTFKVCVCCSGGGGNFQALIDSQKSVGFTITKLIVDRDCKALERARDNDIPRIVLEKSRLQRSFFEAFDREVPEDTDLIVLAGFMPVIPQDICAKYHMKMINTHPSLLPAYGGKGMYGVRVQEAVLTNHEEFAGCSVHFVSPVVDGGELILQHKIRTRKNETAWDLGGRVFLAENALLPQAIGKIMRERGYLDV
ncbi:formyltransferase family protein [Sulfitobacter sp. SK011]|uniref:formyltransferase family protein n=1 Tax=Sulfitobacter sp. SK011 TaxID=1389004 RepID=UPI000E0BBA54|nr:formyltransferase family protein [Sulfitobacter sp. SK011]AXI40698.1 phosphoribosylglycinamide formyltransferase [Sulfitobacter sp. SK011]